MENREFICIRCPLGCNITVETDNGKILNISGNTCPRGADYVTKELTDPRRIVTSLVKVTGGERPVVSVKTAADIPKDRIWECVAELKRVVLEAPVHMGDVVLRNVCGTEIDVVSTGEVACK